MLVHSGIDLKGLVGASTLASPFICYSKLIEYNIYTKKAKKISDCVDGLSSVLLHRLSAMLNS